MLTKLDDRTRQWLIPDEHHEIVALVSDALGEWGGYNEAITEMAAMRLEFSVSFDYDLTAVGSKADKAVGDLKALFGAEGTIFNKAADSQLTCLLANLYLEHKRNPRRLVGLSQHHGKAIPEQYNPSGVTTKTLVRLKGALLANEYVFFFKGHHARGKTSRQSKSPKIVADPSLIAFLENECGWTLSNIRFHRKAETIRMRSKKDTNKKRILISYTDTPDVEAQRKILEKYNAFMAEQDVQIPTLFDFTRDVFMTRRTLTDESWQLGGRLFGGGFQQLSKEERKRITINGEPVVELGIKSCHAKMAFAHVGIDWYARSDQDLYSRLEKDNWPRDVVKKAFNIMMNAKSRRAAIGSLNYEQARSGLLMDSGMVPFKKWSAHLVQSIQDAYPELEDVFFAELGNHFMNKEGNICMAMADWGVQEQLPVLTIHDSFICPTSMAHKLGEVIGVCFDKTVSARCLTTR